MTSRRPLVLFAASVGLAGAALALASSQAPDFWSRPDRRGDRLLRAGRFDEASKAYSDPYRRGVALYRAGDFKEAAAAFTTVGTPEAAFDRGNSLVMLGKYDDAIASYDRALSLHRGWHECEENRAIAFVRRNRLKTRGGDETGGQVKADKIVFEKGKNSSAGQQTEVAGGDPLDDEQLRALWLRRVQTKPADFLRSRFALEAQSREKEQTP
jgi:Ca-activated chloride channel family protein